MSRIFRLLADVKRGFSDFGENLTPTIDNARKNGAKYRTLHGYMAPYIVKRAAGFVMRLRRDKTPRQAEDGMLYGKSHLKGAYTESISTGPELIRICYINPVRYERYDII